MTTRCGVEHAERVLFALAIMFWELLHVEKAVARASCGHRKVRWRGCRRSIRLRKITLVSKDLVQSVHTKSRRADVVFSREKRGATSPSGGEGIARSERRRTDESSPVNMHLYASTWYSWPAGLLDISV
ncbi:hypothetical protein DPSP01_007740 [Paraphaeosphaeria sporulosa]